MKKIIIIAFVALMAATSCVSKKSADRLMQQKDSLSMALAAKDSIINDVFISMSSISENLTAIKVRENIITTSTTDNEIPKQTATRISEDIQAIDELLIKNKDNIEKLKNSAARLRKANIKIAGLEKMVAQLQQQVTDKDTEIERLKASVQTMNIKIQDLGSKVASLRGNLDSLDMLNTNLTSELRAQESILNTCYYIVGSQRELLDKEIVYKKGLIGRTLKINENHSLNSYTKIDLRGVDHINIGHKKVNIVSTHPESSYELVMNTNGVVEYLKINDKQRFWESSKGLVIAYK